MKYLFFFNGQPLLLCCVCCKIAIQDFVTGLHKQNTKHLRFHRRVHRRTITRRYFTESWKKFTGLCHFHRRTIPVNISQRVAKRFTGLCHNHRRVHRRIFWRTISTDVRTSRSPRMSDTCPSAQIPTDWPTSNTDGITNGCTHILKRTHVRHVSVCTNTDRFADGSKSLAGFSNFFGAYYN